MLLLLIAAVLTSDGPQLPDADLRDSIVEPGPLERHALWVQPVFLTVAPIATTAADVGTYLAVPLGATLSLDNLQLSIELTGYGYHSTGSTFFGGFASIGPTFHTGESALGGFFLTPKLAFDALHESTRNRSSAAFMAGLDGGWQKTWGRLYLAFVLGVTAGWSFGDSDWFEGPGFNGPPGFGPAPARPVVGLNMNMLRVGLAL
jgi:hypothetical protein